MADFAVRVLINALALIAAVWLVPNIKAPHEIWQLLVVAAIFGLVNTYIKPIAKLLSLPLNVLTFGLVGLVVNTLMLLLVALLSCISEPRLQDRRLAGRTVHSGRLHLRLHRGARDQHRVDHPVPDSTPDPGRLKLADAARAAAGQFGTPLYLYDLGRLRADVDGIAAAFPDPWIRLYSMKANSLPALVARDRGARLRCQRRFARRAGFGGRSRRRAGVDRTRRDRQDGRRPGAGGRPGARRARRCCGCRSSRLKTRRLWLSWTRRWTCSCA